MNSRDQEEIKKRFAKIARELSILELSGESRQHGFFSGDDIEANLMGGRCENRFLGFYTLKGIERILVAYGFKDRLEEKGISKYSVEINEIDNFNHELKIFYGKETAAKKLLVEVRIHTCSVRGSEIAVSILRDRYWDVFYVDWMLQQNPLANFSIERPPLPDQEYPGLGIGRETMALLYRMALRLNKDGILAVPQFFHNAAIFNHLGFRFLDEECAEELATVIQLKEKVSLSVLSWAVLRECIEVGGKIFRYRPGEMIVPVSIELKAAFQQFPFFRKGKAKNVERVCLNVEKFIASLEKEPISCIFPEDIAEDICINSIQI